ALLIEALRNAVEALAEAFRKLAASERETRESADLLEAVIEGIPDPIYVKDGEGRFARVNSAMAAILGAPKKVIIGNRGGDFLPQDMADRIEEIDRAVIAS